MRILVLLSALLTLGCQDPASHLSPVDPGVPPDLTGQWASSVLSSGSTLALTITATQPAIAGQGTYFTRIVDDSGSQPGPALPMTVSGTILSRPATLELQYSAGQGTSLMRFEIATSDASQLTGMLHEGGDYSETVAFVRP